MKNRRGFALVMMLSLLPVGLAVAFAAGAGGLVISERREAMNSCRTTLMTGLKQAAVPMQRLLDLNPVATALRLRTLQTQISLAAAVASWDIVGAAYHTAQLAKVMRQRRALDRMQKALYESARVLLVGAQTRAFAALNGRRGFLNILALPMRPARPALRPKDPGLAPTWEKMPRFPEAQRLDQSWQWTFTVGGNAANFLKASHREREKCSATLNDSESPFFPEIR